MTNEQLRVALAEWDSLREAPGVAYSALVTLRAGALNRLVEAARAALEPPAPNDEMHEREPLNIIMRYKAERTTIAEAAAEIRAYVAECMRRAVEPNKAVQAGAKDSQVGSSPVEPTRDSVNTIGVIGLRATLYVCPECKIEAGFHELTCSRWKVSEPSADAKEDRAYYNGARQAAAMAHQSLDAMDDWIEGGCGGRGPRASRSIEGRGS